MGKKVILGLLCFIFLFSFVSAQPPFQQSQIIFSGIDIESPVIIDHKVGEDYKFHAHAHNATTGLVLDNSTTNCTIHIFNPIDGDHVIEALMDYSSVGLDFNFNVGGGNFSEPGQYSVLFYCEVPGEIGGFFEYGFDLIISGSTLTTAQAIVYLISFSFLIFIFGLLMWAVFQIPADTKDDEGFVVNVSKFEYLRPIVKGLAWIVLTGIVFVIANITIAYLSTGLMGSFLFLIFTLMLLSNIVIIPLMIIRMIQRITLSKDMLGLIERGVKF